MQPGFASLHYVWDSVFGLKEIVTLLKKCYQNPKAVITKFV